VIRATPLASDALVGVQASVAPPGGQADVRCALDGGLQPDGTITAIAPDPASTHPSVVESVFRGPARGRASRAAPPRARATTARRWSSARRGAGRWRGRKLATGRARFGAKRARIAVRRPRKRGFYFGRLAFGGTHFIRASTDPNPLKLSGIRRRFGFAAPRTFPRCPGYRP
jgi:hypothetical protein